MTPQDEPAISSRTPPRSNKPTASSMLELFSPNGSRQKLNPAQPPLPADSSSQHKVTSTRFSLSSLGRAKSLALLENPPRGLSGRRSFWKGDIFEAALHGKYPFSPSPERPSTPPQASSGELRQDCTAPDDATPNLTSPLNTSDLNYMSNEVAANVSLLPTSTDILRSTAGPSTPKRTADSGNVNGALQSSPEDTRGDGRHSLRSRDKLTLSAKAKENLERGLKDPRQLSPAGQKFSKTTSSPWPPLLNPHEQALRDKQDAFLCKYQEVFTPLLSDANHITKKMTEFADQAISTEPKDFFLLDQKPHGITATLRKHQLEGISFLVWLRSNAMNGILGDEMGLGKTLQTLSILQYNKIERSNDYKASIVVCPLSVLATWEQESQTHVPGLRTFIYHSITTRRSHLRARLREAIQDNSVDIVLVSYETYVSEQHSLKRYKWSYAILDEGHKLKNADSKTSQALQGISADYRVILTGTPIQNDLFELWSLLHWLLPNVFNDSSRELFKSSFDLSHQDGIDVEIIAQARKVLELIMLRRTKEDLHGDMKLPPLTQVVLSVPMVPQQREVYKACITKSDQIMMRQIEHEISECKLAKISPSEKRQHVRELMNILMQLRKVAVHPYLIPGIQPNPYIIGHHIFESSGKFLVLKELISKLVVSEAKKIIIFSGFKGVLDCIEDLISTMKENFTQLKYLRIDGDGSKAYRNLSVRLFQEQCHYQIMLASIRAGGFGITLTAAEAVIFMDMDWNPQVALQAAARAHRIGQTKDVTIYKLLSRGTVEEQMERRIAKKLYLSAKVTDSFKNKETTREEEDDEDAFDDYENASNMTKFSMTDLASIICGGKSTLALPTIPFNDMVHWNYEDILSNCEEKRSVRELDADAEQKWLQEKENVRTTLFEGINHKKVEKAKPEEMITQLVDDRGLRRIGKETTVMVDGIPVSKWSLEQASEQAVATARSKSDSLRKNAEKPERPYEHIQLCIFCQKQQSEQLLECSTCPSMFHEACIQKDETLPAAVYHAGAVRQCPAHKCCECLQSCSNSGGLLYKCIRCPRAFCEDHVKWSSCRPFGFQLGKYIEVGFGQKQSVFYLECKVCSTTETPIQQPSQFSDSLSESTPSSIAQPLPGTCQATAIDVDDYVSPTTPGKKRDCGSTDLDESPSKRNRIV